MAVNALTKGSYSGAMASRKRSNTSQSRRSSGTVRPVAAAPVKIRPNRIFELTKRNKLTYGEIASQLGTSETQIGRLAAGQRRLTQDWMEKLASVFAVKPSEIIERPLADHMRSARVIGRLAAGVWSESHAIPDDDQYDVMVPIDPGLGSMALYAVEIEGDSMNRVYPDGSIVILSRVSQRPGEIALGKRYHVRITRLDGEIEETIKTLTRDAGDHYWLQPESDQPQFHAIPLEGAEGETVELIGRVRYAVRRED